MPSVVQDPLQTGAVIDLTSLSTNFPMTPYREVLRHSITNTLFTLLQDNIYAVAIEGPEGIGKTTILSEFSRRNRNNTISLWFSAANRLSYDPDLVKSDLTSQVYWSATGEIFDRSKYDPALLKGYYIDLQHKAKQRKQQIYFVVDGVDELDSLTRETLLQHLADILPIGVPQFRFLFAGDESLYRPLLSSKLSIKSFPLTEFGNEDVRTLFSGCSIDFETLNEINVICRGIPGRLAAALRAIEKGTPPGDFIKDAPTKWPEFFEIDWQQVRSDNNDLNRILALLAHDPKPHNIANIASILSLSPALVERELQAVTFLYRDPQTNNIGFVSSGLRKYVAERLQGKKKTVQQMLIKRLLATPQSDESILDLPGYLEDATQYADLLTLLTPDHIIAVLERTQTLSRVDDTVRRGLRGAHKLSRHADILRFSFQQSIIADLASANVWASEVAALAALKRDAEALALANNAMLREDRLQLLTTYAHHTWLRGDVVPAEQLDQIRLLIGNVDFVSLGKRADSIASQLTCVSADLASIVITKSKHGQDDNHLDQAFVRSTASALRDLKDEQRRSQVIDSIVHSRKHTKGEGLLEGVRVLSGRFLPEEVCERTKEISKPHARIAVLRYWCVLNGGVPDANIVAMAALNLAIANSASTLDSDLLADLSQAIVGAKSDEGKRELIGMLDGLRATAERLGPSVDFVRLQLSLALSEMHYDQRRAEGRFLDLTVYVAAIADLPSKGQAYAQFLGALKSLPQGTQLQSGDTLELQCAKELEEVVLILSESTADHYLALGGIICGLAAGDLSKALDYTKVANTEARRDAILVDVVRTLLRSSTKSIQPLALKRVVDAIKSSDDRDEALAAIFSRFSDESPISKSQLAEMVPLILLVPAIADSMDACRALVCSRKLLAGDLTDDLMSLRTLVSDALHRRWSHMDVGWARVDAGYGICRDLVDTDIDEAIKFIAETDSIRKGWRIAVDAGASTYISSIQILIRSFCGLLPRRLDTQADIQLLVALIDILPSFGERAVLWADIAMRAHLVGRAELANTLTNDYLYPAFSKVPHEDNSHRATVLMRISPALYKAQPAECLTEIQTLNVDDQDATLLQIIRFLLFQRVPSEPIDAGVKANKETSYDTILQIEQLAQNLTTDWMIYSITSDIADAISSHKNKYTITVPQREDIARRFSDLANAKLPSARHIAHIGFRIATLAQAARIVQTRPAQWQQLIREADELQNVSDRVLVLQMIALCLPRTMSVERLRIIDASIRDIPQIPWQFDQIGRLLGFAEQLYGDDTPRCRELIRAAATTIAQSEDDVRDQRKKMVDIAYRVDEEFAKSLIDAFDDDAAKKRARDQIKLLEIRKTITDTEGQANQEATLNRIKGTEVHKLGLLLLRSLNGGRIQHFHPNDISGYMDLAAGQPLRVAHPMLCWYVENAVLRYAQTDQAATFIRPMFEACAVGTQLAGQISGRSLIRLNSLKNHSTQLSSGRSLLVTPESREQAMHVLTAWLMQNLGDEVLIHDPYFGPDDLQWLQLLRTANPGCVITFMTSRKCQPEVSGSLTLEDLYEVAWRKLFDQRPPKAEMVIIGGEKSKASPIHDRWLVSGQAGLRFGSSLNHLGVVKDSEISEMSAEDAVQKRAEIDAYLTRDKTEHHGEPLRLSRFWL
jgi:hypothetical protein